MAVVIRLKPLGGKRKPFFRLVVTDSRKSRDGKSIEELGHYNPTKEGNEKANIKVDRVKYWLDKGAQLSDTVRDILKKQGILASK